MQYSPIKIEKSFILIYEINEERSTAFILIHLKINPQSISILYLLKDYRPIYKRTQSAILFVNKL